MNPTPQRFHGWKEIATHFNRSVRCVQRWERQENLPVHRHTHTGGNTIFAFLEELDAWQDFERTIETKSVAPPEKEKTRDMRSAPTGHKIRGLQNLSLTQNFSEKHIDRRATDLQNIAHELALVFLRTAKNRHLAFTSDDRAGAISAAAHIQNRSASR